MKLVYPIVITKDKELYLVAVPDLEIDTQGKSLADAIEMARDAISLWICNQQDEKKEIPAATDLQLIPHESNDIVTLVDVNIEDYRRRLEKRMVRKNLTIPSWLNEAAEKQGINFSQVLQDELRKRLNS